MTSPSTLAPVVDREASLKRLCGNEELLVKMAEFFLEDAPALMKQITEAYQSDQLDIVAHRAHGLRGLSATFEAIPVVALTREVEQSAKGAEKTLLNAKISELQTEFDRLYAYLTTVVKSAKESTANSKPKG